MWDQLADKKITILDALVSTGDINQNLSLDKYKLYSLTRNEDKSWKKVMAKVKVFQR